MKKLALLTLTIVILGAVAYSGYEWIYTKKTIFQEERVDSTDIDQIVVRTSSANVEVLPANSEEIEVVLKGKSSKNEAKNYQFKVKESDGKVHIQYVYKKNTGWFQFDSFHEVKLQIKLPEKDYKQLMVKSSSGNISLKESVADQLFLESSSGNIKTVDNKAVTAKLRSTSGTIEMERLVADQSNIHTSSGDISVKESVASDQLFVESTSGNIKTDDNKAITAKLRSTSGTIKMDRLVAVQSSIHTSSGDIEISNEKLDGDMTLKSTSGNVGLHFVTPPDSVKIDFLGSSGKANIDIGGLLYEDKTENSARGMKGKGKYRIKVRTSSGDFNLR